jgi:CheY-like chemotaxis protein
MKLLMLDDDGDLLSALRDMLSKYQHVVDCCDNAKDAIAKVANGDYDFVFVDYQMPENDGIWFMKNVRLPRKTKALLMTAYVNRDVINKMFALGACGYIIKPFDEEEIFRHLDYFSMPAVPKAEKPA